MLALPRTAHSLARNHETANTKRQQKANTTTYQSPVGVDKPTEAQNEPAVHATAAERPVVGQKFELVHSEGMIVPTGQNLLVGHATCVGDDQPPGSGQK